MVICRYIDFIHHRRNSSSLLVKVGHEPRLVNPLGIFTSAPDVLAACCSVAGKHCDRVLFKLKENWES